MNRRAVSLAAYSLTVIAASVAPGSGEPSGLFGLDKVAHLAAYAFLSSLGWVLIEPLRRKLLWVVWAVALGGILEIAQLYVPLRSCSPFDFLADVLGVGVGVLVALLLHKRVRSVAW